MPAGPLSVAGGGIRCPVHRSANVSCPAESRPKRGNSVACRTATAARDRNHRRVPALIASAALLAFQVASASEEAGLETARGLDSVVADGRSLIVLHPQGSETSPARLSTAVRESSSFAARSHEVDSQRIHVVELDGETYRAATPIDGPRSRIAFDPAHRKFRSLLPSIRVELDAGVNADAVATDLGATRVTVFESLGFAIVDLPADVHPVDAVRQARNLPGGPKATVRLRAHRIEWK
ncbi:MAG: hypothetical protein OXQ90_04555 [Gammaproteobacteria bacterium]|nr:hypothetical protein [Gammaproteobacteria bacterium]